MIVSTKRTTSKDAACCVRKKTKQIKCAVPVGTQRAASAKKTKQIKIKRTVLSRDAACCVRKKTNQITIKRAVPNTDAACCVRNERSE